MKKNLLKFTLTFLSLSVLFLPVIVLAQPGEIGDLDSLMGKIKTPLWTIFGIVALVAFLAAGILFLTAAGNAEKIAQARTAFLWGVAGVVVGILAYSIVTIMENMLS